MKYEAITMGISSGGWQALNQILPQLPESFPIPILIVQHLAAGSDDYLARTLNGKCRLKVKDADEKEPIEKGVIYLAPANYHLLVEQNKTLSLSTNEAINYARPSIDVLFETAADVYGPGLIGVVFTGASNDGSQGLYKIKERGGLAIVQDPSTAESEIMPRSAIEAVDIDYIVPLQEIVPCLIKLTSGQPNNRK
jgi:two-component system, chemotaxis family, protein-glutamate methylesterase/glutaminase